MKNTKLVLRTIETPVEEQKSAKINRVEQRKSTSSTRSARQRKSSRSRQSERSRKQEAATNLDSISIKHVHSMTKDLLNTLSTVEQSLEMVTKIATVLNQYNINPSKLNLGEAHQFLKKIDPSKLEGLLRLIPQQNKSE